MAVVRCIAAQGVPAVQAALLCSSRTAVLGERDGRVLRYSHPQDPGPGCRSRRVSFAGGIHPLLPVLLRRCSVIVRHSLDNGGLHSRGEREQAMAHAQSSADRDLECDHEHSHSFLSSEFKTPDVFHNGHHEPHARDHSNCLSHVGHSHGGSGDKPNALQKVVKTISRALGLAFLADLWRENLKVCLASFALLLSGAAAPYIFSPPVAVIVQNSMVLPALPLLAVPACLDAAIEVAGGEINIHVLMAVASLASVLMGNRLEGGLLLAMFSASHQAEEYLTERAKGDVKALRESNPDVALVLDPFDLSSPPSMSTLVYKSVPVDLVEIGSFLFVQAGETVPVDGEVIRGKGLVTVEHLTGEAQPIEKVVGADVPGGARSLDGTMIVKATKKWQDSTVARIMKVTQEAQLNRPVLQRWLDTFGERYSQAVVVVSIGVALLGPILFKWPFLDGAGIRGSLYRSLGFMVAASPCALAVAPLAYATAISACASKGILLKGGEALDALARCDTVAFDKTGTLTTGELTCKAIEPLYGHGRGGWNPTGNACCNPDCEMAALAVAAAMERGATHPIARAVVEHSEGMKGLPGVRIDDCHIVPGEGVAAIVIQSESGGPSKALLGSVDYIASSSRSSEAKIRDAAKASPFGRDLVQAALSVNEKITLFHFEDKVRQHAAEAIQFLKVQTGLRPVMLTGDHAASAERVAKAVGIEEFYSCLKPEDKLYKVNNLSRSKGSGFGGLVMVGDGINDAPALAAARVGIVFARRASATAVAVADVLLLQDALDGVSFVVAKARQTDAVVKQSVALALACIFVASLPSILGALPLWLTVLLHEGGTLLVCVNSVRAFTDPTLPWNWSEMLRRLGTKIVETFGPLVRKDPYLADDTTPATVGENMFH